MFDKLIAWSSEYSGIHTGEKGLERGWKQREGCADAPKKGTARLAWIATRPRRDGEKDGTLSSYRMSHDGGLSRASCLSREF